MSRSACECCGHRPRPPLRFSMPQPAAPTCCQPRSAAGPVRPSPSWSTVHNADRHALRCHSHGVPPLDRACVQKLHLLVAGSLAMTGACLLRIELVQMGDDAVCGRQELLVARARGQSAELHLPALAPVSSAAARPLHHVWQHICIPCLQACSTYARPPPQISAARLFASSGRYLQHIFIFATSNARSIRSPPSVIKALQHICMPSTPDASSTAT